MSTAGSGNAARVILPSQISGMCQMMFALFSLIEQAKTRFPYFLLLFAVVVWSMNRDRVNVKTSASRMVVVKESYMYVVTVQYKWVVAMH